MSAKRGESKLFNKKPISNKNRKNFKRLKIVTVEEPNNACDKTIKNIPSRKIENVNFKPQNSIDESLDFASEGDIKIKVNEYRHLSDVLNPNKKSKKKNFIKENNNKISKKRLSKKIKKIEPNDNEIFYLEIVGKSNKFQKPFFDRAVDSIDKIKMRVLFVRYYNAIFIIRISLIIICVVTLSTTPRIQVFVVLTSQILFTVLVIWYQFKLQFLDMGRFNLFAHIFLEVALTFFLIGAQILSFNKEGKFPQGVLILLEIVMSAFLALSILIEGATLIGVIISFSIETYKLVRNFLKKKKEKKAKKGKTVNCELEKK